MGLPADMEELLVDYLFALEPLVFKVHSRRKMKEHQRFLLEVLTRMEIMLPTSWCTVVKHHVVHVLSEGGLIDLGGPAGCTSMLPSERYNTLLRKLAHSTKNMCEGIARGYALIQPLSELRLTRPKIFTLPAPSRTIASSVTPTYMMDDCVIRLGMKSSRQLYLELGGGLYMQLVWLWRREVPRLNAMLGWHQTQVQRHQCAVPFGEWTPGRNTQHYRSMDETDHLLIHPNRTVLEVERFWLNDVLFRTESCEAKMKTTNCGVEVLWRREGSVVPLVAWGKIERIFRHRLYRHANAPAKMIVKVRWLIRQGAIWDGRGVVVREDPDHEWNDPEETLPFEFCDSIRRYNVAFWPLIKIQPDADPRDLVVIRRNHGFDHY